MRPGAGGAAGRGPGAQEQAELQARTGWGRAGKPPTRSAEGRAAQGAPGKGVGDGSGPAEGGVGSAPCEGAASRPKGTTCAGPGNGGEEGSARRKARRRTFRERGAGVAGGTLGGGMGVCRMQQEGGAPELSRGSDCGTQRAGRGRSLQRPQ